MSSKCLRFWRWFCAPEDVGIVPAFCFSCGGLFLLCIMSAFFHGVVTDNDRLKDYPMHRMIDDLDRFTNDVQSNLSSQQLIRAYPWLAQFRLIVQGNCSIISRNLKCLRFTGYALTVYNTLLMHILLSGILPVSVVACLPIITSLISSNINPAQIILLGLFEFSQGFLFIMIMGTFMILKKNKIENSLTARYNKVS